MPKSVPFLRNLGWIVGASILPGEYSKVTCELGMVPLLGSQYRGFARAGAVKEWCFRSGRRAARRQTNIKTSVSVLITKGKKRGGTGTAGRMRSLFILPLRGEFAHHGYPGRSDWASWAFTRAKLGVCGRERVGLYLRDVVAAKSLATVLSGWKWDGRRYSLYLRDTRRIPLLALI